MKPVIFLDMDGVIADFFSHACAMFDIRLEDIKLPKPWVYNVGAWIRQTRNVPGLFPENEWQKEGWFNMTIAKHAPEFWHTIPLYPWSKDLLQLLFIDAAIEIHVLTMPMQHDGCIDGKLKWLNRHYGHIFDEPIVTDKKHLFAAPHHILIDDRQDTCEQFRAAGGRAIEFPQPWNSKHWVVDKMAYVKDRLTRELEEINEQYSR